MRAICRYEEKKRSKTISTPYTGIKTRWLRPVTNSVASAMPPKSAPMLTTLATISSEQAPHNTERG